MGDQVEVRVGDRVFRQRRLTGQARLEVVRALNRMQDRFDEVRGLQLEMAHTEKDIAALREADVFDPARRDELIAERADIRDRLSDASEAFHRARVEVVHAQTDAPPTVDELLDTLTVEDIDRLLGLDEEEDDWDPPPGDGSAPVSEPS